MVMDRAPGRGRYSRRLSRVQRSAQLRRRLLQATALAHTRGERSVSAVVRLAGIGRNTFYESFDDFAHALRAAGAEAQRELRQRLEACCADEPLGPRATVERVCATWLRFASEESIAMRCALTLPSTSQAFVLVLARELGAKRPGSVDGKALEIAQEQAFAIGACAIQAASSASASTTAPSVTSTSDEDVESLPNAQSKGARQRRDKSACVDSVAQSAEVAQAWCGGRPQLGRPGPSFADATQVLVSAVLKILG